MKMVTPGSRRCSMSGGPTPEGADCSRSVAVTVSCCGKDESYAAGVATDAPVSPALLSHHHHADLFSNVELTGAEGVRVE
jgi:hypothetical protein